jgi:serine/threonine-protein kinase
MRKPSEPKTIGRYEVKRLLGHGAMGMVYLAFDPLLKRLLAVKTVRDFDADVASTLLRFQREAEISARLNHPNIVTVHDVGQDPESGPFMAMEYIDGMPLSDLIQRGIPAEGVVHLLLQGMSALQAAEREGIVHRDVKPSNILVSHDGRLKLMDFGIARGEGSRLTQTGQIIGTPSYTAPEALVGTAPSSVSDRYAFAVTAFQMLTCVLPFECPTIAGTLFRIVHEPPLFPEDMSAEVRAVFEKALSKDPAGRYPDLPSFMRDLINALDLPDETKAKFLAGMAGDTGAEVAHLIKAHAEAFAQNFPTQATPASLHSLPHLGGEMATEAFWTPKLGATLTPPSRYGTVPSGLPPVPAPPKRRWRWGWPWWAAAALLVLGILGGTAWQGRKRPFPMDISSLPEGASVLVNGRPIGRTNLVQAMIPAGGGTLRLELEGFEPQERVVRQGEGPVRIELTRQPYTVRVVTQPPGAEAFLNGAARGTTPIKALQVPGDGRQELVLRLADHLAWTQVLDQDLPLPEVIRLVPVKAETRPMRPPVAGLPGGNPLPGPAVPTVETQPASPPPAVAQAPSQPPPTAPKPRPAQAPVSSGSPAGEERIHH